MGNQNNSYIPEDWNDGKNLLEDLCEKEGLPEGTTWEKYNNHISEKNRKNECLDLGVDENTPKEILLTQQLEKDRVQRCLDLGIDENTSWSDINKHITDQENKRLLMEKGIYDDIN